MHAEPPLRVDKTDRCEDTAVVSVLEGKGSVPDDDEPVVADLEEDENRKYRVKTRGWGALIALLLLVGVGAGVPFLIYSGSHVPKAPPGAIRFADRWASRALYGKSPCKSPGIVAYSDQLDSQLDSSGRNPWCDVQAALRAAHAQLVRGPGTVGTDCTPVESGGPVPNEPGYQVAPCVDFMLIRRHVFFGDLKLDLNDGTPWTVDVANVATWSSDYCFAHDSFTRITSTTGLLKPFYRSGCRAPVG